jgi:hypothetical protein
LPIADLGVLDPVVTTTYITRNHGYQPVEKAAAQPEWSRSMLRATAAV